MKVFLAGPIDYWWNENYHTVPHYKYLLWKEQVARCLIEAGHLVYRPDQAWKGAWEEAAQVVNDAALEVCDVFVYLTPPGVPAYGTEAERKAAEARFVPVHHAPPGDTSSINHLLGRLDDPYSDVYRKSYQKVDPHLGHDTITARRLIGRKSYPFRYCRSCKKEIAL